MTTARRSSTSSFVWTAVVLVWSLLVSNLPFTAAKNKTTHQGRTEAVRLDQKELIFFAGPHQSDNSGVEDFFHHWIKSGWRHGHPNLLSLRYWRWPAPEHDYYGAEVFGELMKQHNNATLNADIMLSIKDFWNEAENGIVVGTELFDQVGHNARYDAMTPMNKIVETIGMEDDSNNVDVTVILNYRTPRIEQWLSIWKEDDPVLSYTEFMCKSYHNLDDPDLKKVRISQLSASMNALNAAFVFLKRGWKVKLIDLEGVKEFNKDVTHVIGCDILMGECEDGFISRHDKYRTPDEDVPDIGNEIDEDEARKMEELFRFRDCGFESLLMPYLENQQLEVMYKKEIWTDCVPERKDIYANLANADEVVYTALLSQLDCASVGVKVHDGIVTMDEALTTEKANIVHDPNGGRLERFFNHVVVPIVFIAAFAYAVFWLYKKRQNQSLSNQAVGQRGGQRRTTGRPKNYKQRKFQQQQQNDNLQAAASSMQQTAMSRAIV